jgi:hypothetical protein
VLALLSRLMHSCSPEVLSGYERSCRHLRLTCFVAVIRDNASNNEEVLLITDSTIVTCINAHYLCMRTIATDRCANLKLEDKLSYGIW